MKLRHRALLAMAMTATLGASIAAAGDGNADDAVRDESRELAEDAHREAVDDALARLTAETRLDLDVELPARTAQPASGD